MTRALSPEDTLARVRTILENRGYVCPPINQHNLMGITTRVLQVLRDLPPSPKQTYTNAHWYAPFLEGLAALRGEFSDMVRRDPMLIYRPQHSVADAFHKSSAKLRYWRGGNRTGKTQANIAEIYWFSTGKHPYQKVPIPDSPTATVVLAGLPLKEYAPKVFLPKLLDGEPGNIISPVFPTNGKWFNHYDQIKKIITLGCRECAESNKAQRCPGHHKKSRIYLLSGDQDIKVLEGFQAGLAVMDEHSKEAYYKALKQRIATVKNSRMNIVGTPLLGPQAWEPRILVKQAESKRKYDPGVKESPLAVEMFQIDQFSAGLVPHAEIRNTMKDYDKFEIESKIYGRPAAIAKKPVFSREVLAVMEEKHSKPPIMGHLRLATLPSGKIRRSLEEIEYVDEVYFEKSDAENATEELDEHEDHFVGMRVWQAPRLGGEYIIGVDSAQGIAGGDRSSATVLEVVRTGQEWSFAKVAEFYGSINILSYADECKKMGVWYNTALIIPERTGVGLGVMERLRRHLLYPNIYTELDNAAEIDPDITSHLGIDTNPKTKPRLIGFLQKAIKENKIYQPCLTTTRELVAYEQTRDQGKTTTKYGGASGSFDDRVMSLALALYPVYTLDVDNFSWNPHQEKFDTMVKERLDPLSKAEAFLEAYPWK